MIQPSNTASSTNAMNPPISGQYMGETYYESPAGCWDVDSAAAREAVSRTRGAERAAARSRTRSSVQRHLLIR